MPRAVISARPAPLPPSFSLPRPAPSATPCPNEKTFFIERTSLFDDDLRKNPPGARTLAGSMRAGHGDCASSLLPDNSRARPRSIGRATAASEAAISMASRYRRRGGQVDEDLAGSAGSRRRACARRPRGRALPSGRPPAASAPTMLRIRLTARTSWPKSGRRRAVASADTLSAVSAKFQAPKPETAAISSYGWPRRSRRLRRRSAKKPAELPTTSSADRRRVRRVEADRLPHDRAPVEAPAPGNRNRNDAESGPAQAVGVLRDRSESCRSERGRPGCRSDPPARGSTPAASRGGSSEADPGRYWS